MQDDPKLVAREKWDSLSTEEIRQQIAARAHWINHLLVGQLYRSIMFSEVETLQDLLRQRLASQPSSL